tara:strand:- start:768 stop:944 length:177 start_codon:yes stop_codon:yes gene_type:complete
MGTSQQWQQEVAIPFARFEGPLHIARLYAMRGINVLPAHQTQKCPFSLKICSSGDDNL